MISHSNGWRLIDIAPESRRPGWPRPKVLTPEGWLGHLYIIQHVCGRITNDVILHFPWKKTFTFTVFPHNINEFQIWRDFALFGATTGRNDKRKKYQHHYQNE